MKLQLILIPCLLSLAACSHRSVDYSITEVGRLGPNEIAVVERQSEWETPWYEPHNSAYVVSVKWHLLAVRYLPASNTYRIVEIDSQDEQDRTSPEMTFRPDSRRLVPSDESIDECGTDNRVYWAWSSARNGKFHASLCGSVLSISDSDNSAATCRIDVANSFGLPRGYASTGISGALSLRIQATGEKFMVHVSADPGEVVKDEVVGPDDATLTKTRNVVLGISDNCHVDSSVKFELPEHVFIRALGVSSSSTALLYDRHSGNILLRKDGKDYLLSWHADARFMEHVEENQDFLYVDDAISKKVLSFQRTDGKPFVVAIANIPD